MTGKDKSSRRRLGVVAALVMLGVGWYLWRMEGAQPPMSPPATDGDALSALEEARAQRDTAPAASLPPASAADPALATGDEATLCARTLHDAEQFATEEMNAAIPAQARERDEDWWSAELESLQRKAAGSRDPELFLTAVLLDPPERRVSEDPVARTTLLDLGVRATEAGTPLMAWHALRACVEAGPSCPYEHSVQSLVEADRENAESWVLLATLRHRRGDVAGALAAMHSAARAPTSTWYWAETVALAERSLAAATSMSYQERVGAAFSSGASAANPSQSRLANLCREEAAGSRPWAEACLAFGTLRGERGGTVAERLFAYSLRKAMLTALGDAGRAAEVDAERALFEAERMGGGLAPIGGLHSNLVGSSPARGRAYLDAIEQFGEVEGSRVFLRRELPLLMQRAGLLEREGARECVAQFFAPREAAGTRAATAGHLIQVADEMLVSVRGGASLETVVRVRPDGRFMMPLSAAVTAGRATAQELERRIAASGRTTRPLEQEVAALGKTPGQLEREIATLLTRTGRTPEVQVILLSTRSREELRREFETALQEAVQ